MARTVMAYTVMAHVVTATCQSPGEAAVSLRNGNHAPENPKHVAKNNKLLFQE